MLNSTHPDDERLSALASRDAEAAGDPALAEHLATCDRCTTLVADLGVLRATLADLPDLQPPRPLRLLPDVERAPAAGGASSWIRRLFTPALTAGAALAMVGLVGTTVPLLGGAASGAAPQDRQEAAMESAAPANAFGGEDAAGSPGIETLSTDSPEEPEPGTGRTSDSDASRGEDHAAQQDLPAERSLWPMVLFSGVALMIGAALLRWILVPRAG